ncbi:Protein of unknown function DUF484 [Aequoribacter fuscus]|uniref:Uncharacterized protein n=1 Tax=Aequoribacter fuscus TaxID=2518989 RepID=F3L283_9GAMM|nr:DUF484 family protein [Aequoribacter fuscus]EGG29562.1 Protein of unknown function DUF484 [Aequoribacter fuscus]QHJ88956.1 DUF484 family protein [Aequoribacter fuscus]
MNESKDPSTLNDSAIEAYLLEHPEFFKDKAELLTQLSLPHGGHGAVSLVERQQAALRERNVELRHQLSDLTRIAEDNDKRFHLTSALVQDLIKADSKDAIKQSFERHIKDGFGNAYAGLRWFDSSDALDAAKATLGSLINTGKPFAGALREAEMRFLFGPAAIAGSACIVTLGDKTPEGLVALGSKSANDFGSDTGTLFIEHVASVINSLATRLSG